MRGEGTVGVNHGDVASGPGNSDRRLPAGRQGRWLAVDAPCTAELPRRLPALSASPYSSREYHRDALSPSHRSGSARICVEVEKRPASDEAEAKAEGWRRE
jgi:hypothetical protein